MSGSQSRSICRALPPYLGGKRRLCPTIFREIDRVIPREHWHNLAFLDGFLGGGALSLFAKAQGFSVTSSDIAARSIVIGEALIANNQVRLIRDDLARVLAIPIADTARNAMRLVPAVFAENVGAVVDRLLRAADQTPIRAKAALFRLLAVRVAMLAHPMSQVRPGTAHRASTGEWESITPSCLGHYVDALRLDTLKELWRLAQKTNAGVIPGRGRVIQGDVLKVLPEIRADIAYFDPPYSGVMSYEKEYRIIDQLLEGITRPTSPFTARDGASMIDTLLDRAQHVPIWILSFGNAVANLEELEAKMIRRGRQTKAIAIRYQHLPAIATEEKKEANREYLLIGVDPRST
ncbi:MAG TPA: DNA adenine methylase, partial [Dehalococcoidia bacterium]|nr:DNA adenine methylase [Dehalococcoidia bacterium]